MFSEAGKSFSQAGKDFLNWTSLLKKKKFLYMAKPGKQNHPHNHLICPVHETAELSAKSLLIIKKGFRAVSN